MKNLIVSLVITVGTFSAYALPNTFAENIKIEANLQNEYTEVNVSSVPEVVIKALEKAYPGAKLVKAYVSEKKEYKLDLSVGDQKATVYSDVNGNWLK